MGEVHRLRLEDRQFVGEATLRVNELADALRCIDKIMAPDEEPVALIANDLRGLIRVLTREVDAIGGHLGTRF